MTSSTNEPPFAPSIPHVHHEHGIDRPDEYAWMKDKLDDRLLTYLSAERSFYDQSVAPLAPLTDRLAREMRALVAPADESARWRQGKFEYFTRTAPGAEYDQFWRVGADGRMQLLLDENVLMGESSYIGLGVKLVSPDSRRLAYSVDIAGDEVYHLRFRDLTTGEDLSESVKHTYYGGAWSSDSSTFFYVVHDEAYRPFQVWRHRMGSSASDDVLVFQEDDEQFNIELWADRAGDFIVVQVENRDTSEEWLIRSSEPTSAPMLVAPRRRGIQYSCAHLPGSAGGSLLIVTNEGASEFQLAHCSIEDTRPEVWSTLAVTHADERLHQVEVFSTHSVLALVRDGHQLLRLVRNDSLETDEPLNRSLEVTPSFLGGLLTLWHNEEFDVQSVLLEEESYVDPPTWFEMDLTTGERRQLRQQLAPTYDRARYQLEQRWTRARDGEQIPIKVVHHVETPLDGSAPMVLYGYGAYESSFWPGFEQWLPSLLDRGVVFVHAGIRGGGELGRRWWLGGRLHTKKNTFTDFIDVAEQLARDGVVDGERIVGRGLSAGGLLQGAVFSMAPDRWRAIVAEVPFVDVVNSMFDSSIPLTANEWDEWGDPRKPDDFEYLRSYSPYENVPSDQRPILLATGAVHDPRVMVHEPAKWVARLRATAKPEDGRVLFRVETGEGGHVGPTGRYSHLGYEAEVAAFILDAVDQAD